MELRDATMTLLDRTQNWCFVRRENISLIVYIIIKHAFSLEKLKKALWEVKAKVIL